MKKLTHEQVVARQREQESIRVPLVVILDNIRSLNNVGAVFRTADGVGLEKIWLCGITGYPPQSGISKTALGAEDVVPWDYSKDVVSVIQQYKKTGYEIVLLEQTDTALSYHAYEPAGPVCLVIGNEVDGVHDNWLVHADTSIEIPMAGLKNSLNVAVAFGVVAFDLKYKLQPFAKRMM